MVQTILHQILTVAQEKGLQTERLAILKADNEIHRILINQTIKYPRVLFIGYKSGHDPAIPYGIARFLSKVPKEAYSHIGIEIIPIANPVNIPLEKTIISRIIKDKIYSMCVCLKEYDGKPHCLKIEGTERSEEVSQRILETTELIVKTDLKVTRVYPSDKSNLEERIYLKSQTPFIRVSFPSLYEFYDRVTAVSRTMEDCIHESLYNFKRPLSIFNRILRESTE